MGRDKAGLVVGGEPLWQRQWSKLQAAGAAERFISGRVCGPWSGAGLEVVVDRVTGAGPLGGIVSGLHRAQHAWLLVLAVDLPDVPVDFLRDLVQGAVASGAGQVPARNDWLQPLAAVYPRASLPLAEECLASLNRSVRHFFRRAQQAGFATTRALSETERGWFRNLNTPDDLAAAER